MSNSNSNSRLPTEKEPQDGWDDMGEAWRAINKARQKKRASNRESSPQLLAQVPGVEIEFKNGGAHLIVHYMGCTIDFWPGTGRWIVRGASNARAARAQFGVKNLIRYLENMEPISKTESSNEQTTSDNDNHKDEGLSGLPEGEAPF